MTLGRQMHDLVDPLRAKDVQHPLLVANIGLLECVAGAVGNVLEGLQIAGISQLVDVDDMIAPLGHQMAADRAADEACPAGDQYPVHRQSNPVSIRSSIGASRSLGERM